MSDSTLFSGPRREFIAQLNHFVHPSEEVSDPLQLKGRDGALLQIRDAFETTGTNAFIWGIRGVGKTSLVHTACTKFSEQVHLAAAISCHRTSTFSELLNDIYRRVVSGGKVNIRDAKIAGKLSVYGFSVEGTKSGVREAISISSVNQASDFLATILPDDYQSHKEWVIIIDEFDLLENKDTIDFFTTLAKQMSVDKVPVKFVFCGVA